jgi:hypothetical protein
MRRAREDAEGKDTDAPAHTHTTHTRTHARIALLRRQLPVLLTHARVHPPIPLSTQPRLGLAGHAARRPAAWRPACQWLLLSQATKWH